MKTISIRGRALIVAHMESVSSVIMDRIFTDEAPCVGLFGLRYKGYGYVDGDWFFSVRMASGKCHEFHSATEADCEIEREEFLKEVNK